MIKEKVVIFDLDGTLVDSDPTVLRIINSMRISRNLDALSYQEAESGLLMGGEELIRDLVSISNVKEILDEFRKKYLTVNLDNEMLFPYAKDFLNSLKKRGKILAICTNKPRVLVEKVLKHHKIFSFFDVLITSCDVNVKKPDPEGLLYILDSSSMNPKDALFIGDSNLDYQAAIGANIKFKYFNYKNKPLSDSYNYSESFNCFKELI